MRRLFWVGVGVAASVAVYRWARKQRARYGPEATAAKIADGLRDLGTLVRQAMEEGARAMDEKEAELRAALGDRG